VPRFVWCMGESFNNQEVCQLSFQENGVKLFHCLA